MDAEWRWGRTFLVEVSTLSWVALNSGATRTDRGIQRRHIRKADLFLHRVSDGASSADDHAMSRLLIAIPAFGHQLSTYVVYLSVLI